MSDSELGLGQSGFMEDEASRFPRLERNSLYGVEIPTHHLVDQFFDRDEFKMEFAENGYREKLPSELQAWREQLVADRIATGERLRNGETLAIDSWRLTDGAITLQTREGKYYDDLATHFSLDHVLDNGRTVRSYVDEDKLYTPDGLHDSVLAATLGMGIVVETSDNQIVLQERSNKVLIEPGSMQQSVGEGIKTNDARSGGISQAITRGLREELGISRDQEVEVVGSSFGITEQYLQPTLSVYVRVPFTAEKLGEIATTARGQWERSKLVMIPFERSAIEQITKDKRWATPALYCLASAVEMKEQGR